MARQYTHAQETEKEMLALKAAGKTNREIAEEMGFKNDVDLRNSMFFYVWGFSFLSVSSGAL